MSKNRLSHMGLAEDNLCVHCGEIETQAHVVKGCTRAVQLWEMVRRKEPAGNEEELEHYWCGLMGGDLELKMECLWHLINNKELTATEIFVRSTVFIDKVKKYRSSGQGDIDISKIL